MEHVDETFSLLMTLNGVNDDLFKMLFDDETFANESLKPYPRKPRPTTRNIAVLARLLCCRVLVAAGAGVGG